MSKLWKSTAISILNLRKVIDIYIHTQMFEMIISECCHGMEEKVLQLQWKHSFYRYFATCICNLSKATIKNNVGYKQQVYRKTLQYSCTVQLENWIAHNHCHYLHPSIKRPPSYWSEEYKLNISVCPPHSPGSPSKIHVGMGENVMVQESSQ